MSKKTAIERLEELLIEAGFGVPDGAIKPATGYWKYQDVHRWEARLMSPLDERGSRMVTVNSWNTVTDCVKRGITVHQEDSYTYEVCAKAK